MDVRALLPQSKKWRVVTIAIAGLIVALSTLYLFLLAEEAYSARTSSKMLDRLELLRMGDPATEFERAVQGCKIEKTDSEYTCMVTAGAFRFEEPWKLIWKLPDDWDYTLSMFLARVGLRYWRLAAFASVHDGRIQSIAVGFSVVGRYETLGARWAVAEQIPELYQRAEKLSADQQRTHMGWFHITSIPGGEGFSIHVTADSTEKELGARHINRGCMLSFLGCDGLCELLPDAVPVLNDRNQSWGGCTGVPASRCELKNDGCGTLK